MRKTIMIAGLLAGLFAATAAGAQTEDYASWPVLKSTFPSTGGGGFVIKGYDPVIIGGKCLTTFMAVDAEQKNAYPNFIEFEAVAAAGGTLCQNGKWRAFPSAAEQSEGPARECKCTGATGETPFRLYFKDGVWRGR